MSAHSLGFLTITPGTPVRFTFNQADPAKSISCNSIMAEAIPKTAKYSGNQGPIYILDRPNPNYTTGIGVLAIIPVPTTNLVGSYSAGNPTAMAAQNAGDFYADGDFAGDLVAVSYLR